LSSVDRRRLRKSDVNNLFAAAHAA